MALVEPLSEIDSPEFAELALFFNETLGFPPNSVLTMQRRPEIAAAFIALNKAVMKNDGEVTSEQKRLIGHVSSLTSGCRYCQAHTALAAERYETTDERLANIWNYENSSCFTEAEKAAFRFAQAASSIPNAVDNKIAEGLKAHWAEGEIVEILGVIALFGYLNRWNDSMGTKIEGPASRVANKHLTANGWEPGKHG